MSNNVTCKYQKHIDELILRHQIKPDANEWQKKYIKTVIINRITRSCHPYLFLVSDFLLVVLTIVILSALLYAIQKNVELLFILLLGMIKTLCGIFIVQLKINKHEKEIKTECENYLNEKINQENLT